MPRLRTFAHTLQTLKFNTVKSIQKVYTLVHKVNKSTVDMQSLIGHCGRKLIGNCPTRWSSSYLLMNRLLDVKLLLNQILMELDSDRLWSAEWKVLEHMHDMLEQFVDPFKWRKVWHFNLSLEETLEQCGGLTTSVPCTRCGTYLAKDEIHISFGPCWPCLKC